jgi:hypothetical protein
MKKIDILLPIPINAIAEKLADKDDLTKRKFIQSEIRRIVVKYESINNQIEIDNRKIEIRIPNLPEELEFRLNNICNKISVTPSQLLRMELFLQEL